MIAKTNLAMKDRPISGTPFENGSSGITRVGAVIYVLGKAYFRSTSVLPCHVLQWKGRISWLKNCIWWFKPQAPSNPSFFTGESVEKIQAEIFLCRAPSELDIM